MIKEAPFSCSLIHEGPLHLIWHICDAGCPWRPNPKGICNIKTCETCNQPNTPTIVREAAYTLDRLLVFCEANTERCSWREKQQIAHSF